MAAKGTAAVGSAAWVSAEKENVVQFLQQEKEELVFPAQHEMEWLNEHMAEIFSQSYVDVANVFKTPGKLRGKTPRTVRQRIVPETRIPLSDVFSSKPLPRQSPEKEKPFKLVPRFAIATDAPEIKQPSPSQPDSGYHGSSQEQNNVDYTAQSSPLGSPAVAPLSPTVHESVESIEQGARSQEIRTTEGSFHSAKEDQTTKIFGNAAQKQPELDASTELEQQNCEEHDEPVTMEPSDLHNEFDEIGSPSDESTPDRPLVRKSSLTFASLPAREPLKKSIGARISRTSHTDQNKARASSRNSQPSYDTQATLEQGDRISINMDRDQEDEDVEMEDSNIEILGHDESEDDRQAVKQYSKSSTQRLHDKINMLGKAPAPRPSKSIPSAATLATRQSGPNPHSRKGADYAFDDDDDWIKPMTSPERERQALVPDDGAGNESDEDGEFDLRAPELIAHEERVRTPVRMSPGPGRMMPGFGHTKSASTATLASPAKLTMVPPTSPAKSISVSNPAISTTTPQGSPNRYNPLSASKSKLQSIMKTAKGLFTSSASVSAAAKLETLSPNAIRMVTNTMPGMYPDLGNMLDDKSLPPSPAKEVRKTRGSTEREKEEKTKEKAMQKMDDQLEKAREKEKLKAAQQKQNTTKLPQQPIRSSPRRAAEEQREQDATDMQPPNVQPANSKLSRPVRPGREPAQRAKPAPVAIRVGTLSQRMPMNTSSLATSNQETLPAEPKRPGLTKKPSNASVQSSTSFKAAVNAQPTKPKALLAAERKKEHDEREAQRKLEQKREIERKRAAQQEEARRQEQKQRAEAERKERERIAVEQTKRQAQQQAIERKRLENAKKIEQQRLDRATSENASNRPPSRLGAQPPGRSLINHPLPTNPAKPAKRPLEEETNSRPQASKYGAASEQADSKRRRTEDENIESAPRPTMSGAPIRQSHTGKKPSIFNHSGYAPAPPSHLSQFPQPPNRAQPPQMSQYANAKIPFADAANPPVLTKTPASAYLHKTIQAVKSSPQYPNGDAIHLPEIPTDSEDEDSDDDNNAFPIPDWATPGHLTNQLIRQEGMDGDAVFGPIAPLKMEEIFAKGNKERLKRLRDRTSSANWAMSGDGLTLEEVRADREQRERMRVEGGWRYGG